MKIGCLMSFVPSRFVSMVFAGSLEMIILSDVVENGSYYSSSVFLLLPRYCYCISTFIDFNKKKIRICIVIVWRTIWIFGQAVNTQWHDEMINVVNMLTLLVRIEEISQWYEFIECVGFFVKYYANVVDFIPLKCGRSIQYTIQ